MRRVSFALIVIGLFLTARSSSAFGQHVLDSTNFHIEWSNVNPNDPERIDVLQWKGGPSLTLSFPGNLRCHDGNVEYFGNAWAPPDPEDGGIVLVGLGRKALGQPERMDCPPSSSRFPVAARLLAEFMS